MIEKINPVTFSGSLHSHGCWTDYRNPRERKKFPFDLKTFLEHCISCDRDFQAITDIMACWPGKPEFREHRYAELLKTADPRGDYEVEEREGEAKIYLSSGKVFYIPRSQEILTDIHFKHILAVGSKEDIPGGRNVLETLRRVKDRGGTTVLDHIFMCDAWTEEEVMDLYQKGLIDALEWNGGLTFSTLLPEKVRIRTPNKESNLRVLAVSSRDNIPAVSNDDSHCSADIEQGAYTSYHMGVPSDSLIQGLARAIKAGHFKRVENYSSLFSPVKHLYYGTNSRSLFGERGLPDA